MSHSLFYWGVARIYQYGLDVAATDWDSVSEKKKTAIDKKITAIAKQITLRNGRVNPGFKTKGMFYIIRMMQKNGWNNRDVEHWKEQCWIEKKRPWKL